MLPFTTAKPVWIGVFRVHSDTLDQASVSARVERREGFRLPIWFDVGPVAWENIAF